MTGSQKGSDQMVVANKAPKKGLLSSWKPLLREKTLTYPQDAVSTENEIGLHTLRSRT